MAGICRLDFLREDNYLGAELWKPAESSWSLCGTAVCAFAEGNPTRWHESNSAMRSSTRKWEPGSPRILGSMELG
jgi:hypothetical protein